MSRFQAAIVVTVGALPLACSPPAAAPLPDAAVRAVVISDLNSSYGSTTYTPEVAEAVRRIVSDWRPDLVLAAGDLVAGQSPALPDSAVRAMWRAFDGTVAAPLREAGIPFVFTLGNHDASAYPGHARDRRLAVEHWREADSALPFAARDSFPLRYSVRVGSVFVAAWDATRQESAADPELLDWLRGALASPEAVGARHRVVLGHLPLYGVAVGRDRPGEVLARGDSLRRRLEEWGATLYVSGHHHAYYPARRGGLDLLHAGALGEGPRPLIAGDAPPRKTVSVLDFRADSVIFTTFEIGAGTGEPTVLLIETLPPLLCGRHGWVRRRDLPPPDAAACAASGPVRPGSAVR